MCTANHNNHSNINVLIALILSNVAIIRARNTKIRCLLILGYFDHHGQVSLGSHEYGTSQKSQ